MGDGFVKGLHLDAMDMARWADAIGVPVDQLVAASVAGSEITTVDPAFARQQQLAMHCLLNRQSLCGFRSGFPGHPDFLFSIAVGDCGLTGPYGEDGRPFSSSRLATGRPLLYLLDMAARVRRVREAGDLGEGVTSLAHKHPQALQKLKVRWARIGYEVFEEFPWPDGRIGAFFRPTKAKRAALEAAAKRARAK